VDLLGNLRLDLLNYLLQVIQLFVNQLLKILDDSIKGFKRIVVGLRVGGMSLLLVVQGPVGPWTVTAGHGGGSVLGCTNGFSRIGKVSPSLHFRGC
jgi:hypothetical protein